MSNKVQLTKSNSIDTSSKTNELIIKNNKFKQIPATTAVYGAQHPPSLKAIHDLTINDVNNQNKSKLKQNPTSHIHSSNLNTFSAFEKETYDAWNINSDSEELNDDFLKISIEDSNEMAKKVIKDHSDKQKASLNQTNTKSNFKSNPGPGKALRQEASVPLEKAQDSSKQIKNQAQVTSMPTSSSTQPLVSTITSTTISSSSLSSIQSTTATQIIKTNPYRYSSIENEIELMQMEKFQRILSANPINLGELEKASWKGIPKAYRPVSWKLLSDYLPLKIELQEKTIEQKRNSYWKSVNDYYSKSFLDPHSDILRQILNDLPRMNPLMPLFQKKTVQDIFQRILYVWSVKHPGTGYVQGINDLVTPFFAVFLTEYLDNNDKNNDVASLDIINLNENELKNLEADCYCCMTKLLDRIQENYVFSQPGIQKNVQALEELIKRMDEPLHKHLKKNNIEFLQFAFRWMNNLLMREIPLQCTIRLWDTYHAEPFGFSDFHLYVCAAFLLRFSKDLLKEKDFQDLMLFLQNLPTRSWNSDDITLLTAEAYKLQVMFANAPKHINSIHANNGHS